MTNRLGAAAPSLFGQSSRIALAALFACFCLSNAQAQDAKQPWEEYDKLITSRGVVTAHGSGLFGDKVDLYRGALSFSVTDISLPGNSSLPVALTRTMTVSNRRLYPNQGMLADWELDLPHLTGVYAPTWAADRCSATRGPGTAFASSTAYGQDEYWQGVQANMPGGGEMLVANQSAPRPSSGGPYPWMTSAFTYFSCLPSIANGAGEGFLAITSDGTRYWFNHMAQYYEPQLASPLTTVGIPTPHPLTRKRVALYATRVEDRFGNWVIYSYSNSAAAPARLSSIQASDGRQITLTYNPQGHLQTADNGSHSWTYGYVYPAGGKPTLTTVTLPDTSRWSLNLAALSNAEIVFDGDQLRSCEIPGMVVAAGPFVGSVTHPSGAVGEFEVGHRRLGRSNVPMFCANWEYPTNNRLNDVAIVARDMDVLALARKSISGPGVTPATWVYDFTSTRTWAAGTGPKCETEDCLEPVCVSDSCAGSTWAKVTGPDNRWKRYTFGNSYRYNEGKLREVEQGEGTVTLRTETTAYELAQSGQPFATPVGSTLQGRGGGFTSSYLQPKRSHAISQDGATFSSTLSAFDAFARPSQAVRSSSLGYSRTELTAYHDNLSKWVLGQVAKVTKIGTPNEVVSETGYSADYALPIWSKSFGQLQHTLGYTLTTGTQDGTLHTVTDGRLNVTTLTNWKRGIPQLISHADTTRESALVNDDGTIASVTDENGYTACYEYDAMGRLEQVVHPSETQAGTCDASTWNTTTQAFVQVNGIEYGIPAGHWRQTVSTGNGHKVTYFDALWQPLLVRQYDVANVTDTQRFNRYAYDSEGRVVFESYPNSASNPITGIWTGYDALGRVVRVEQDSEFEVPLVTTTEYLSGFRRRTTNPRGKVTTESFHAFDVPTYSTPSQIDAAEGTPEQVRTLITRDVFGKPTEVVRGPGG